MKKTFKKLSVLFFAGLLMVSLCGCTMKSMRKSHAVWSEDSSVLWQNYEYLPLTEVYGNFEPLYDYETTVCVTTKDVPLLLQYFWGEIMYPSTDGRFLIGDSYIYCKSSDFDAMQTKLLNGGEMTSYCYEYYDEDYKTQYCKFSKKQVGIIKSIFENAAPKTVTFDKFYQIYEDYYPYASVYKCSDDLLFREMDFEFYSDEDNFLFVISNAEYFSVYEISAEYAADIEYIFEKAINSY